MTEGFIYQAPTRLVFGEGKVEQAGAEASALGMRRVLIITGSGPTSRSEGLARLRASLDDAGLYNVLYAEVGHDPDAGRIEDAARRIEEEGCDGVIAFGGGSPLDCAKAAALYVKNGLERDAEASGSFFLDFVYGRAHFDRPGLPLMALPTTAGSGSEMSANVVTTDLAAKRKIGLSNPWFFPRVAIVDPELQATMPAALTAATGMDALTHALESFVSRRSTPLTRAIAGEAAGLILGSLGAACSEPPDMDARANMALASSMVAIAFSQTGLGMVHGFAHPVGARGGVAHGVANAVILPYVAAACAETIPEPFAALAAAAHLPVAGLSPVAAAGLLIEEIRLLEARVGIPGRLGALGLPREALPEVLADALSYRSRASSPRAFTDAELGELLERMY